MALTVNLGAQLVLTDGLHQRDVWNHKQIEVS